jgi:hypothetical protein
MSVDVSWGQEAVPAGQPAVADGEWQVLADMKPAQAAPGSQGRLCPLCLLSRKLAITFPAPASSPFPGRIAPKQPLSKQKPPG